MKVQEIGRLRDCEVNRWQVHGWGSVDSEFKRWGVCETACSRDWKFTIWRVQGKESSVVYITGYGVHNVALRDSGFHEMYNSGDGDFSRWGAQELGSLRDEEWRRWGSLIDWEFKR